MNDGSNIVLERIVGVDDTEKTVEYFWGKDISGTFQGAGGVGGLLYLKRNGSIFVPIYDAYGNVMEYRAADESLAASYVYDAFGRTVSQAGSLADVFRFRHATKSYESETGLYYYGKRFYSQVLRRWFSRDPISEYGGMNVYVFCKNDPVGHGDYVGLAYFAKRALLGLPWIKGFSMNTWLDNRNAELSHENLFFEDGKEPSNIGYFDRKDDNPGSDSIPGLLSNYVITDSGYDDCIMREAVKVVKPKPYSLWGGSLLNQYNCQDYAQALRDAYFRLLLDLEILCKCRSGK